MQNVFIHSQRKEDAVEYDMNKSWDKQALAAVEMEGLAFTMEGGGA